MDAEASSTRSAFTSAGFTPHLIPIPPPEEDPTLRDLEIYALRFRYGSGGGGGGNAAATKEPLLLVHGHPQNLSIWHRVAPELAKKAERDLVLVDLRGHGHSGTPRVLNFVRQGHDAAREAKAAAAAAVSSGEIDERPEESVLRARYSKRACGRDLVHVMVNYFKYTKFAIAGHDRGGRIAHRMALDHPDNVTRVMVLDIVPTFDLYDKAEKMFATAYWHWFFLIQPYPIPEEMIVHSPKTYLHALVTRFLQSDSDGADKTTIFPQDVLASYLSQLSSPPRVHAMCEDYRCSAPGGIDLLLDEQDREAGKKVQQPLRVIWGAKGINEKLFGKQKCLSLWQNVCATTVTGQALDCGHYMPEEAPDEVTREILSFFGSE